MSNSPYIYENDITWSLPCFFQYEAVFGAMQHYIELLGFKYIKADIYGSPACLWTGGRKPVIYDKLDKKTLENLFGYIKKYNGTGVFAFNNTQITKEDLNDGYCNLLLDTALEHDCKFIVYSDILKDYIKNKKQNAYVISSILKPVLYFQGPDRIDEPQIEKETRYYNKLLEEYDMVSVRSEYSKFALVHDTTLIKDLSRIQVLINQSCLCNCNLAAEHAKFNEHYNLSNDNQDMEFICPRLNMSTLIKYQNNSMHTQKEIQILLNAGVNNLKLKGRGAQTSPEDILRMFASWILRSDSGNYLTVTGMGSGHLDAEVQYFNQLLRLDT